MDIPLEPPLIIPDPLTNQPGRIAGRPLGEWNAAYGKVESYFHALRVRNKVLLGRLVIQVLNRAMTRAPKELDRSPTELAAEELDLVLTEWFAQLLQESPMSTDHMLTTRGRLALLIADMPGKWQDMFLRPGPWPPEFVQAMREAYLRAGPDFQLSKMAPRPLELGPLDTFTALVNLPYKKTVAIWAGFALLFIALFVALLYYLSH